jgi:hypothetical protein
MMRFDLVQPDGKLAHSQKKGIHPDVFTSVIQHIQKSCTPLFPRLHTLQLILRPTHWNCYHPSNTQAGLFCDHLSQSASLKTIKIHGVQIPNCTLTAFSNSHSLNSLTLLLDYDWDVELPPHQTLPFKSLKTLSLSVAVCERITDFLKCCQRMPLESVEFFTAGASHFGDTLQDILGSLEQCTINTVLQHFTFATDYEDDCNFLELNEYDRGITIENILSLQHFSSLETLQISRVVHICQGSEVSIGLFLAQAVPNLVRIGIDPSDLEQNTQYDHSDEDVVEVWKAGWNKVYKILEERFDHPIQTEFKYV